MPVKTGSQRNIVEQIEDLRRKIQLLEGDRRAYYETAEYTMKQNREKISKLRVENKELRKEMGTRLAADERVVKKGLENNPEECKSLRSKPGQVAVVVMDEKLRDRINVLNNQRYRTAQKQRKLDELKTQQEQMCREAEQAEATDAGSSEEAKKSRSLENRLDKSSLKCKEAEHIQRTYYQIKSKLEDEHKTFENSLDDMEDDIKRMKRELKELETMRNDAQIARDIAKAELEKQEKKLYEERRQRELELQKMRKEAEEKRMQQEIFQRRIAARSSMTQDDLMVEQRQALGYLEDDQQKISTYDEAFRKIKEATGVSDTQEVVMRFESQGDTQKHLEQLQQDNEKEIERLREEKAKLNQEYEEMKYSGEAKLSRGQHLLEENESHLKEEEMRRDAALTQLEKSSKILQDVKSGIEHLAEKLKSIKSPAAQVQKNKIPPTSDEYVLDQLTVCEEKLLKLMEELDSSGRDVNEVSKQMEDEEFHNTMIMSLPTYNTRVTLPAATKDTAIYDDNESGDDEEALSREHLKQQSQQLVDSKTRRRPGKRKKKTIK